MVRIKEIMQKINKFFCLISNSLRAGVIEIKLSQNVISGCILSKYESVIMKDGA